MIKIKNIYHFYLNNDRNKIVVFDALNLEIKEKEIVSIVGPSGCGKTTLVNIVAGYIKPISGEVLINNKSITGPGRDRVVINQGDDLFEWMTVANNIRLVAKNKSEDNIEKYIKLVHLSDFKNAYPKELSGGMKKKLSLVRALAAEPEFIIMDEPFASLDYQAKEELYEEFLNIVMVSHKTILLVTHDIEEAIFLSNRVVVFFGTPASIKQEVMIPFLYPRDKNIKELNEFKELKLKIRL
ncbi:MAG: ABC transporter ATP-binding protein [Candidatus Pacebacteria bacterium]|nr:ABC transporter ATP-binding protein [Candidatus Paceibacterota bacterium]